MASTAHLLRFSPLSPQNHLHRCLSRGNLSNPHSLSFSFPSNDSPFKSLSLPKSPPRTLALAGSGGIGIGGSGSGSGGGGGDGHDGSDSPDSRPSGGFGPIAMFLEGWRSRVAADPQFPFKVLMEELVGVTSCVAGDMASRPNFGLNELDFVFSTLVVGSILNFTLMYLLAPSAGASASLPAIFAGCPKSHMFEPGAYSLASRLGTLVFKGAVFAGVGLAAGLVGTAISNGLLAARKKMDPEFETPNKAPPTMLNALTWAAHMGISSNLRYQSLNGLEFVLEKSLPGVAFKSSVIVLRCLNNVLGGMSFVVLARMTGSQSVQAKSVAAPPEEDEAEEKLAAAVEHQPGSSSYSK